MQSSANENKYFFADLSKIGDLNKMFEELIAEGNSVGAKLGVCVENCPVGLGEPVFDKLNADLAKAIMIALARSAFSLSKTGSPKPTGQFSTQTPSFAPTELPSAISSSNILFKSPILDKSAKKYLFSFAELCK